MEIQMEQSTVASTSASANKFYHVFINHRGPDVKKTFASHLYHRLCSAHSGLRVFLDQPELRVGHNFDSQIKDAIRTASVHVAIFSPSYAESEWCLNELLYMLDSESLIIPVFYHVEPAAVRWPNGKGVYADALRILEDKKTHKEKPRYDPATMQKWREALSTVSVISGLDLHGSCNGDEGALVEKIIQRVLEEIKSISGFYCSQLYGGPGAGYYDDGTYSGIRRISMTAKDNSVTSLQLYYGLGDNENDFSGKRRGIEVGDQIEYILNYPEEIVTQISGYIETSLNPGITSLTFHTNQRNLGPCGQEKGNYFETEVRGKIVGVFGSSGTAVDSIGVYMLKPRSPNDEEFHCSRLYGSSGEDGLNKRSDRTYSGIRRITMTANNYSLTSVQLHYGLEGDESLKDRYLPGRRHGGLVGNPHLGALGDSREYNLNYPEEIVTKISGHLGEYKPWPESWYVVKSLTFHTNKGKYGPCGKAHGTYFETEEVGRIVGVFADSGTLVDSIGVYMLKAKNFGR